MITSSSDLTFFVVDLAVLISNSSVFAFSENPFAMTS